MTRVSTPSFSCSASQLARRRSRATTERQAANGTKLSAIRPSTGSRLSSSTAADADQDDEQHEPDHAGVDHGPHALDVEHAAGDQLAGVDAVVEAEAQALQLGVVGHAQVVGDALPDRLALVVLPHREQAAQHGGAEQQRRRPARARRAPPPASPPPSRPCALSTARPRYCGISSWKTAATIVVRDRDRHRAAVAQRHREHAAQHAEIAEADLAGDRAV